MAGLFSPSTPKAPMPIAQPTVDQTLVDREAQDMARRRRGRAATVLAGDAKVPDQSLAAKQLLGG